MASSYSWYLENQIIYVQIEDSVTLDDLKKGNRFISQCLDAALHRPVHILYDMRQVERIKVNSFQVRSNLKYLQHPNLGWLVAFGLRGLTSTIFDFMITMLSSIVGRRLHSTYTFDEALAFLHTMDKTLPGTAPE